MLTLGIETSCDETGLAFYDSNAGLIAQVLHTQAKMHADYGGVVPELASRDHIHRLPQLFKELLRDSGKSIRDVDAIAYTAGPGLAGALLAGAAFAEALALACACPVIPTHHLEAHLLSPLLAQPAPTFPFVALLVSGGHTQLLHVEAVGRYHNLGETLDDAAGEAFDKTAKLLGLPYPGGPALAALAERGVSGRITLPRPMLQSGDCNFSFSGLKTAVLTQVRAASAKYGADATLSPVAWQADLARGFEDAVTEVLVAKAAAALKQCGLRQLVVAGGVSANLSLRARLADMAADTDTRIYYPPPALCTDNGAMIAFCAAKRWEAGIAHERAADGFAVHPRWPLSALDATAAV